MLLDIQYISLNFYIRTESTAIHIKVEQNESIISFDAIPYQLQHDIEDMLEVTVGPSDNYDGIKACLTYNSPGTYKPGYQRDRGVSIVDIFQI